jgi:hypothetical protein
VIEQKIRLPYIPEPVEQRIALLDATKAVRKAVVKQAAAFAQPIWWQWKPLTDAAWRDELARATVCRVR